MEYGAKFQAEELHLEELGIATLSALFANANRDPKKGQPASPKDFFYFQREEDEGPKIPVAACDAFFSLVADGLLPGWALGVAPLERLRTCRSKNGTVRKPRAWISDDLILILPRVEGKEVVAALALSNGVSGFVELRDPDVEAEFCLNLSEAIDVGWGLDIEFERFSHEPNW